MAVSRSAIFTTCLVLIINARWITSEVQLHSTSTFCNKGTSHNDIICNLQGNQAKLLESNWNNFSKCTIANGSSLVILPQCKSSGVYFSISNTTSVMSDLQNTQHTKDCRVRLDVENCSAIRLGDLFSEIHVSTSRVDYLKMAVEKFDIKDESDIESLHIKSYKEISRLSNSKVNIVDLLEIEGIRNAEISHSKLGIVKKFIYNASSSSDICSTEIGSVERHGFEILQDLLKFTNVTFHSLSRESIIIHGGTVLFKDVTIKESDVRSIVMKGNSKFNIENVNLRNGLSYLSIKFTYDGNQSVYVLRSILTGNQSFSVVVNIAIGLTISIVFWVVVFVSAYFRCQKFLPFFARNNSGSKTFPPTTVSVRPSDAKPPPPSPVTIHSNNVKSRDTNNVEDDDYETIENMRSCHSPFLSSGGPPQLPSKPPPKRVPPLPLPKVLTNFSGSNRHLGVSDVCKDTPSYEDCKDFQNTHLKSQAKEQIHLQTQGRKDVAQKYYMGGVSQGQRSHNVNGSENFKTNQSAVVNSDLWSKSEIPTRLQGNKMLNNVLQKGHATPSIQEPANSKKSFLHSGRANPATSSLDKNCSVSSTGKPVGKLPIVAITRKFRDFQLTHKNRAEQDPDDLYEPIPEK